MGTPRTTYAPHNFAEQFRASPDGRMSDPWDRVQRVCLVQADNGQIARIEAS